MTEVPTGRPSSEFERRLMTYAVTAGAVLAASAQDAAASPITRLVNLPIPVNSTVPLDVDNNGVDDFTFSNSSSFGTGSLWAHGYPTPTNGFLGYAPFFNRYGLKFGVGLTSAGGDWGPGGIAGAYGNPASNFATSGALAFANVDGGGLLRYCYTPNFCDGDSTYYPLPLRFDIGGSTHFGWARIKAEFVGPGHFDARIRDVGWETTANTSIHLPDPAPVPEPATLGLLALGAAGLLMRRKAGASKPQ